MRVVSFLRLYDINLVRKVTRFKNVSLSADWTLNALERKTIKTQVTRLPTTHIIKRTALVKKQNKTKRKQYKQTELETQSC